MSPHHASRARRSGFAALSLLGAVAGSLAAPPDYAPNRVLAIREWVVLGPIAAPQRLMDGADYLTSIGGEAKAALADGAEISLRDGTGALVRRTARRAEADASGVLDLNQMFPATTKAVAYAYSEFRADKARDAVVFLGSDDWAKVWLNGQVIYSRFGPGGRGVVAREDAVPVRLKAGRNALLVKVDQADGGWGLQVEIAPPAELAAQRARETALRRARRTEALEVGPRDRWQWVFEPGPFPEIAWTEPEAAAELWGDAPLKVRWFDADLNEVSAATKPGRYAAYVEAPGRSGQVARRALTFYCTGSPLRAYEDPPAVSVPMPPAPDVPAAVWAEHRPAFERTMGQEVLRMLAGSEAGPIWLAGLMESEPLGRAPVQLDTPEMRHQDYHLRLKQRILGTEGKHRPLSMPTKRMDAAAPVLRTGTPAEAGLKPDTPERVRAAARAWNEATGIPFSVVVARHGIVAFHEAFGSDSGGPVTVGRKFALASLTKTHTGLMFAQFLDQGLIGLDDPVGKYLPGFATEGPNALTLRHCLTNTSGFDGHGMHGGMMNPWLDSALAGGMAPLEPGRSYLYNGMGYDLAGKVMEIVSGKSIFRLMHENFFRPLGQDEPTIEDLAYGITCTVMDLARTGQLMLNKGSYGDTRFFSTETFENQVYPRPLKEFFPDIANERNLAYNMGMNLAIDGDPENPVFGKNTLMHGSATGAILRVDYDHDLVVAVGRPGPGPDYGEHSLRLLKAVAGCLAE